MAPTATACPQCKLDLLDRFPPTSMDPDCAICSSPANARCDCEAKGLDIAVRQAESKMMTSYFSDIRTWVRSHAQDYILTYYEVLTSRRREAHRSHVQHLTEQAAYYRTRPHPSEIAAANAELKRGIDEDWRNSVQRYPGVLEYFYSLVTFTLPREDDIAVKDPPLSALSGARKAKRAAPLEGPKTYRGARRPWVGQEPPPPPDYMYAGPAYQ